MLCSLRRNENRKIIEELKLYDAHSKAQKQYNAVSFATRMLSWTVRLSACQEVRSRYKLHALGLGRLHPRSICLICLESEFLCQCKGACETCGKQCLLCAQG